MVGRWVIALLLLAAPGGLRGQEVAEVDDNGLFFTPRLPTDRPDCVEYRGKVCGRNQTREERVRRGFVVHGILDCARYCQHNSSCRYYAVDTADPGSVLCVPYDLDSCRAIPADPTCGDTCNTYRKNCKPLVCSEVGTRCVGHAVGFANGVNSAEECAMRCRHHSQGAWRDLEKCNWFTFNSFVPRGPELYGADGSDLRISATECMLFNDCPGVRRCPYCVSGEADCIMGLN